MANDINKEDPHYKGEYGSIYEVNRKFPTGGVAGDFVVIEGWAHYWNADRGTWCVNAERDSYWDELITNIIEKFKLVRGATYMGVASLDTVPAKAIGAKMYYFATVAGTYKKFGNLVVPQGINVLYSENGSSWVNSTLLEVAQELGVSTQKVVSQKVLNDVLLKKFDKANIVQESGEAEDKVMSQKAVSDKLSDLDEEIGEVIPKDNNGVCYQYDNFLDNNNLVGDIRLNKRFVTNDSTLIDANGYSCIVLENIEGQRYLNVRCTPSQYVSGVVMLDQKLNYDGDRNIVKEIFTSESLHNLQTITKMVEIPNGVKCIIVQANNGNGTEITLKEAKKLLAASFSSDKFVSKTALDETKELLEGEIGKVNLWFGKNIWWCGTSIPAAGYWDIHKKDSYPLLVGEILNANVVNEAVGSSIAASYTLDKNYDVYSRCMGQTVAEKIALFEDTWRIDSDTKTVSDGNRTLGLYNIPIVSTYQEAIFQLYLLLHHSYEIKLVSYLIEDDTEHLNYIKEKLGAYYNIIASDLSWALSSFGKSGHIDLFVIDHSNNDSSWDEKNYDSFDMKNAMGAINSYIHIIYKYNPKARIVILSNYNNENTPLANPTLKKIAEYWQIPFFDIYKKLPFIKREPKLLTCGYWDSKQFWHDSGFTWEETDSGFKTNLNLCADLKGNNSLEVVKNNINPQNIKGKWFWETTQNYIWMYDGLHPHSDKSGQALKLYSEVVAACLREIGSGK